MATRNHDDLRIQALQILDALLVWLAFWVAWDIRDIVRSMLGMGIEADNARDALYWVLYIAVPFTPIVLERFEFYREIRTKRAHRAFGQLFKGIAVIGIVIAVMALLAKYTDSRRLNITIGFFGSAILLFIRDRAYTHYLRQRSTNDASKERIMIAGTSNETHQLLDELDEEITESWKVVAHFDLENQPVQELYDLIKEHSVERVIFSTKETSFEKVALAVEACELQGVEAWIAASFIRSQIARPAFDVIGNKPMLVLRSTPDLSWELMCKDLIDRIGASLIILCTLPLWLVAYIGIRIQSPGASAFFCQKRAGRYGKPFKMWKFRTMVPNAEELLNEIKAAHGNEMDGPVFKLDKDPRVFPFGALLRKLSIDELPQLLNVVTGEMSLVGPRPLPLYEVEAFSEMAHRRRLSVKPGITCEWQVGGRNKITKFEDWVALDLRYIDNWSLWLDFVILLKTIPAVLFGWGAK